MVGRRKLMHCVGDNVPASESCERVAKHWYLKSSTNGTMTQMLLNSWTQAPVAFSHHQQCLRRTPQACCSQAVPARHAPDANGMRNIAAADVPSRHHILGPGEGKDHEDGRWKHLHAQQPVL